MSNEKKHLFKVVLLGESNVGKTFFSECFAQKKAIHRYGCSIGPDFLSHKFERDGKLINLHVWDTAGQERFGSLGSYYFRAADGVFFVFDLTSVVSFQAIPKWIEMIENETKGTSLSKILIGAKSDLSSQRSVTPEMINSFCAETGLAYFETSSKDFPTTIPPFEAMVDLLLQNYEEPQNSGDRVDLAGPGNGVTMYPCCS